LKEIINLSWDRFKIIAAIIGDVQGRSIATLFFFTILVPFGLASRMFSDPLRLKPTNAIWVERPPVSDTLEAAKRQG
jgi:hypothetical protein